MISKAIKKNNKVYISFIMLFYMIIFRDLLEVYIPLASYLDELFAIMAIPIAINNLYKNRGVIRINRNSSTIWLLGFILIGLFSNVVYRYQPFIKAVLPDILLNLKFWLSIFVGQQLFKDLDLDKFGKKIGYHVKFVIWIYVALILLDNIAGGIFPADIRYGVRSTQLFYGVHTVFCAMCAFLLSLITLIKKNVKHSNIYTFILILLMLSTMRSKAFGAVALFLLMYYLIFVFNKKISIKTIVVIGLVCLFVGWSQIQYYFFSSISDNAARNVLLRTSLSVAKDHFPFGAGFATFASHYSGLVYSPLYQQYGISGIYGLTSIHPVFVSDSFWPMIIGQNGFIGAALFAITLYVLFRRIQLLKQIDKCYYVAALFAMGYLCISSLAESAFVNSFAVPLAMVIGICVSKIRE